MVPVGLAFAGAGRQGRRVAGGTGVQALPVGLDKCRDYHIWLVVDRYMVAEK